VRRLAAAALVGLALPAVAASGVHAQDAGAVTAPAEIASDCSVDVTDALNRWIASVPDERTLELASGGCYRIDGTVRITDRAGLVLDGRGATLRAGTEGDQARRHLSITGGRALTVRSLTIRGSMPNSRLGPEDYREDRAFQHGIELRSVTGATVEDVQVLDVFGDFVYVGRVPDGQPSRDVTVSSSRFVDAGRQGISVTAGERVTIRDNEVRGVALAMFDLEPNAPSDGARSIRIEGNTTGRAAGFWLSAPGTGEVRDVTVAGNVLRNAPAGLFWVIGTPEQRVTGVAVEDNELRVGDAVYASTPIAAFFFTNCDNVVVAHNRGRFRTTTPVGVVEVRDCANVTVDGNVIEGAGAALADTTGTPVPR
jgi:hypothetical protein